MLCFFSLTHSQAIDSGKKPEVVEKMTEGRLRKYFEEVCLVQQNHMVEEGNPKIADLLEKTGKDLGVNVELVGFLKFRTGEA